jgi:hypothetical protein
MPKLLVTNSAAAPSPTIIGVFSVPGLTNTVSVKKLARSLKMISILAASVTMVLYVVIS